MTKQTKNEAAKQATKQSATATKAPEPRDALFSFAMAAKSPRRRIA